MSARLAHALRRSSGLLTTAAMGGFLAACVSRMIVAADDSAPSLGAMSDAYQNYEELLNSILVEYEESGTPLVNPKALYECLKIVAPPNKRVTQVVLGRKVYLDTYSEVRPIEKVVDLITAEKPELRNVTGDLAKVLSFDEIEQKLPLVEPEVYHRIQMFDGQTLWEKSAQVLTGLDGAARAHYIIAAPERKGAYYFAPGYLDYVGYGVVDPGGTEALAAMPDRDRIVELAAASGAEASTGDLSGVQCLVVKFPAPAPDMGGQTMWFDPSLGYALRKRVSLTKGGTIGSQSEFDEFVEVVAGVWLPQRVRRTVHGHQDVPEAYRGQPILEMTLKVTRLQVNQPEHGEYFVMKPEPGSSVTDQRLARQDARTRPDAAAGTEIGKPAPGVSYTQPADDRDLEKVIQQAQAGRDNIDAWSGEQASSGWIIIGVNGVLIVAVIIGLVVYQHRHR